MLSTAAPGIRKGVKIASDTAFSTKATQSALPKLKGDSTVGGNVRSGPEYYAKWDRVAENELKKLQSEDQKELSTPSAATSSNMPVTSAGPSFSAVSTDRRLDVACVACVPCV